MKRDTTNQLSFANRQQILELGELLNSEYKQNYTEAQLLDISNCLTGFFEALIQIDQKTKNEYENRRSTS